MLKLLRAILRFFGAKRDVAVSEVDKARARVYTGSDAGIDAAVAEERGILLEQYEGWMGIAEAGEQHIQELKQELEDINEQQQDQEDIRDAALDEVERFMARVAELEGGTDTLALEQAQTELEGYRREGAAAHNQVTVLEQQSAELEESIQRERTDLEEKTYPQLEDYERRISALPQMAAQLKRNQRMVARQEEIHKRKNALLSQDEASPLDAVLEESKRLTARAKVLDEVAGHSAGDRAKQLREKARRAQATSGFDELLQARRAERGEPATTPQVAETSPEVMPTGERPEI